MCGTSVLNRVVFLVAMFFCVGVFGMDRVTMKDGTIYEGSIIREEACCVWIKVVSNGKSSEKMVLKSDTASIEKGIGEGGKPSSDVKDPVPTPAKNASVPSKSAGQQQPKQEQESSQNAVGPRAAKAAVITLGDHRAGKDMVGTYVTAQALMDVRPLLEEELGTDKQGVVVLRFSSGGGAVNEIQPISDEIHNNYKSRFRVVAWIDSAISAAAMSAHCIERIYFTPTGHYGACTAFSGGGVSAGNLSLESYLVMMREISNRGGYHPDIMRAMQIPLALSCTVRENGTVEWFANSTSGEILVNRDPHPALPVGEVLTFNELSAKNVGFSKGTAANLNELEELMGFGDLEWIGEKVEGIPWPVCKAEKMTMALRDQKLVMGAEVETDILIYLQNLEAARWISEAAGDSPDPEALADVKMFAGKARRSLSKLSAHASESPQMVLLKLAEFGQPVEFEEPYKEKWQKWYREQNEILKQLTRK